MAEGADVTPSTPLTLLGSDANGNDISIGSLAVTVRAVDAVSALLGRGGRNANTREAIGPGSTNPAASAKRANPHSKDLKLEERHVEPDFAGLRAPARIR